MARKQPSTQIKVCLVAISLGRGGAERSTALLSRMLFDKGFDVSIVILNDRIDYDYKGTLFNLGSVKTKPDTLSKRLKRFKKLKSFLKEGNFNYIIDNRTRSQAAKELFYLHYLYKNQKVIYVVRSFNLLQYFPKQNWVAKKMITFSEEIVGVSKAIAKKINTKYEVEKAISIYNPIEPFSVAEDSQQNQEKYILYLGRIEEKVKNFTLLLNAYQNSRLLDHSIKLKIVGDGPDVDWLKGKIDSMNLTEIVVIHPFATNVYKYLKNALYLTLTSYYEGFPRVLIEALSVGTPVLSVNCKSGPSEIVKHEENGLLIENHSIDTLKEGMEHLAFNEKLYATCKLNARESVSHLKMNSISLQWAKLLNKK